MEGKLTKQEAVDKLSEKYTEFVAKHRANGLEEGLALDITFLIDCLAETEIRFADIEEKLVHYLGVIQGIGLRCSAIEEKLEHHKDVIQGRSCF
jgi:hypothetical protein